ncbi:MAG: polysaccharide deacetylase family protein [Actinomycetota bacterium]
MGRDNWSVGSVPSISFRKRRPPRRTFGLVVLALTAIVIIMLIWAFAAGSDLTPVASPGPSASISPPSPTADEQPVEAPHFKNTKAPSESEKERTLERLMSYNAPILCGAGKLPLVALTFDDGPGEFTPYTIDTLRSARAPATFFVVGRMFGPRSTQKLVQREAQLGEVGNHTWTHAALAGASRGELKREVDRTSKAIERATGEPPLLFRPPLGSRDSALDRYISSNGMLEVLWSLETRDSLGANTEQILRNVNKGLSAGDIILMHENRGTTRAALPEILNMIYLKELQPVTVTDLLALDPPTRNQVNKRDC